MENIALLLLISVILILGYILMSKVDKKIDHIEKENKKQEEYKAKTG